MKITVVTAVYNGERFLRRMLDSLYSQKGDFELEHIVCDALSTDGTMDILKDYPVSRIVRRKDNGPFDAIVSGFDLATGDIGAWLNADDAYAPGALAEVAAFFEKHNDCRWLYGNCPIIDGNDRRTRGLITLYKNIIGFFYSRNMLLCENFINQPATFWRMELWRKVRPVPTAYRAAWDYDLWLKFAGLSPARHLRRDLAMFRRHGGSISENLTALQFAEEEEIARKYGNAFHRAVHAFNRRKITFAYSLLSRLSK